MLADTAPEGEQPMMLRIVGRLTGLRIGLTFVRTGTRRIEIGLHGSNRPPQLRLWLLPIPRPAAAAVAFLQDRNTFLAAFRNGKGSVLRRLREALLAVLVNRPRLHETYVNWIILFDEWTELRMTQLRATAEMLPPLAAVVFHDAPQSAALTATLRSLATQQYPLALVTTAGPGRSSGIAQAAAAAPFVIVLQAGEVLPPHAALMLAAELAAAPADILLADEDRISRAAGRSDPKFKPQPSLTLMCSGTLSRGVWAIRSSLVPGTSSAAWAEAVRLQAWFGMGLGGAARRVAHILTHRRNDTEAAPPDALKTVVDAGLRSLNVAATVSATFPLRLQWHTAVRGRVSLIVPSRLRGAVQLACLQDVLANTAYPALDMLVVVTQDGPLDQEQAQAIQLLERTGLARASLLERASFNYSVANNVGVAQSTGDFVCLLNDDVSTLEPDWLDKMVAIMSDPAVGIVGAKLYYEDMTTQHGGVIIGLGGLADHVSRLLPRGAPGYMGRAMLDQEMSVVTGACLLVRRSLYVALGGLDEELASAFNDVDFCLRVREMGHRVVFAGSVELIHHETISFGHHYAGRAEQEAIEVRRMQARWAHVCEADPFHNPNLSLVPGKEWTLAFPPRPDALSPVPHIPAS